MIERIGKILASLAWFDELDFDKALRVIAWAKREKLPLETVMEEGMRADLKEYALTSSNSEQADEVVEQLIDEKLPDNVYPLRKVSGA